MTQVVLLLHNIRSVHNVGSLFRTADGCGVTEVICSGYTPYPTLENDSRLPHIRDRLTRQIHKTALGAELTVPFRRCDSPPLAELRSKGFTIAALEQNDTSLRLSDFTAPDKIALLLGEEVDGIAPEMLKLCDVILEIPMRGQKESFNVSVAAGMALYELMVRQ